MTSCFGTDSPTTSTQKSVATPLLPPSPPAFQCVVSRSGSRDESVSGTGWRLTGKSPPPPPRASARCGAARRRLSAGRPWSGLTPHGDWGLNTYTLGLRHWCRVIGCRHSSLPILKSVHGRELPVSVGAVTGTIRTGTMALPLAMSLNRYHKA